MEIIAAVLYILTTAQSFGSLDYLTKSPVMILRLPGVLFCENEQIWIKQIIVCSKEDAYLSVQGS